MKTIEFVLTNYKSETLDGRDLSRLTQFLTVKQIESLGFQFNTSEQRAAHIPIKWTKENILIQLQQDVAFGFEKALGKRGISAGLMFSVVRMWNWILEEGLEDYDENTGYAQYGLPLFKATAVKYDFPNEIGEDEGNEDKYAG